MRARRGVVSIAELLLVFWLFGFVLAGLAAFASAQSRLAAAQRDTLRYAELTRTARVVLSAELRYLAPADVRAARDSIRIRAVRGGGRVCASDGDILTLEYRGVRLPEPDKDSVLLVAAGGEVVLPVLETGGAEPCGAVALRVGGATELPSAPALALVFETGTYSVANGALRYRLGAGGRQPLTEAIIARGMLSPGGGGLRLRLVPERDSLGALHPRPVEVVLALLNGAP